MKQALQIDWVDDHREPKCPPNPAYPDGIDLDCSDGAAATCTATLRCPAPRCGYYVVKCDTCGQIAACTTAGRPDDPRSLKMACQLLGKKSN